MAIEAPQVTYNARPEAAVEGMLAESEAGRRIDSGYVETSGGIPVGRFVKRGTLAHQVLALTATGDVTGPKLAGVALFGQFASTSGDSVMYLLKETVPMLRRGRVWMYTLATIAHGVTPFIVHTGAGAGRLSPTANDQGAGESTVAPATGVVIVEGRTGAGLVLVEINLI